jgi:hypothetical protein
MPQTEPKSKNLVFNMLLYEYNLRTLA